MVVITRGCSGAGKSRLSKLIASTNFNIDGLAPVMTPATAFAKSLWGSIIKSEHKMYVLSSDDYHMVDGKYLFEKKNLTAAHQACLRSFFNVVADPKAVIIVDNTNCTIEEFVPYAALAEAFAHELHIITILTDHLTAWKRNKHDVQFANVVKQAYHLQESIAKMPSWFAQKHQVFPE